MPLETDSVSDSLSGAWSGESGLEAGHRCHPRSGMAHPHCAQTSQVRQSAHLSCSTLPLGFSGDYYSLSHISLVLGTSVRTAFSVFQVFPSATTSGSPAMTEASEYWSPF